MAAGRIAAGTAYGRDLVSLLRELPREIRKELAGRRGVRIKEQVEQSNAHV